MLLRYELLIFAAGWVVLLPLLSLDSAVSPPISLMVRALLALCAAAFVPGYFLQSTLFPQKHQLSPYERLSFSFGLSIALIPLLALLLQFTGIGFAITPIALLLLITSLLLGIVSWWRRAKIDREQRYVLLNAEQFNSPRQLPESRRSWLLILSLGLGVIASLSIAISLLLPSAAARLTEFYLLDSSGSTQHYPHQVEAGRQVEVLIGITNREGEPQSYRIEVWGDEQQIAVLYPFHLNDAESVVVTVPVQLETANEDQKVDFYLFREDGLEPYRTLHLWVDVINAG